MKAWVEMKSRAWPYLLADLLLFIAVLLIVWVILGLPGLDSDFVGGFSILLLFLLPALASVILTYSLRFPIDSGEIHAMSEFEIVHLFRLLGYEVQSSPSGIIVHFDSWTGVKIRTSKKNTSSFMFSIDGTHSALMFTLIVFMITPLAWLVVPLNLYQIEWTLRNVDDLLRSSSKEAGLRENECDTGKRKTKELLIDSLSEARRMAVEAYRAANSGYQDAILTVIILLGLVGWMALFAALSLTSLFEPDYKLVGSLLISFGVTWFGCAILVHIINRRSRPKVLRLSKWVQDIDLALRSERAVSWDDTQGSSVELLFSAYDQLPNWFRARRKDFWYRNPVHYYIFFILILLGSSFLLGSLGTYSDPRMPSILLLLGIGSLVAMFLLYRQILKKTELEEAMLTQEFEERKKQLYSKFLEQLEAG
jgi:hypothetical protein